MFTRSFMQTSYFRIPRSLTRNPLWLDLPPAYQHVFMVILDHVVFKETTFDDHGHIITLKPGQLCMSEREILTHCSKYISRIEIQRSIKKLILYKIVSQEVRHRKSIITITHKETYDLILNASEPISEPNLSQTCAKLEPERKTVNTEKKIDDQIDCQKSEGDLKFQHKTGGEISATSEDVIKKFTNEGWSHAEINQAIAKMTRRNPTLSGTIESYLFTVLTNIRKDSCKMKKNACQPAAKTSTHKSSNDNVYYSDKDMSEAPLAKLARQNGYK